MPTATLRPVFPRPYPGRPFNDVRFHPERLGQPSRWRKPRRVFVNSMSDLFHEALTDLQIHQVFASMRASPRHTFQVLTKRPERMRDLMRSVSRARESAPPEWLPRSDVWPLPNVWLGVSVENQATADERIPLLLDTPAAVRFLSVEPLLRSGRHRPVAVRGRRAGRRSRTAPESSVTTLHGVGCTA